MLTSDELQELTLFWALVAKTPATGLVITTDVNRNIARTVAALREAAELREIHIVFDGPPGPEGGRFVEVETPTGQSIREGRWEQRGGYWHLILLAAKEANDGT